MWPIRKTLSPSNYETRLFKSSYHAGDISDICHGQRGHHLISDCFGNFRGTGLFVLLNAFKGLLNLIYVFATKLLFQHILYNPANHAWKYYCLFLDRLWCHCCFTLRFRRSKLNITSYYSRGWALAFFQQETFLLSTSEKAVLHLLMQECGVELMRSRSTLKY